MAKNKLGLFENNDPVNDPVVNAIKNMSTELQAKSDVLGGKVDAQTTVMKSEIGLLSTKQGDTNNAIMETNKEIRETNKNLGMLRIIGLLATVVAALIILAIRLT